MDAWPVRFIESPDNIVDSAHPGIRLFRTLIIRFPCPSVPVQVGALGHVAKGVLKFFLAPIAIYQLENSIHSGHNSRSQ